MSLRLLSHALLLLMNESLDKAGRKIVRVDMSEFEEEEAVYDE